MSSGLSDSTTGLRVLIVSENISMKMGGESSLPYYYAKLFQKRGVRVLLACHDRVRDELEQAFSGSQAQIHYVSDSRFQRLLFRHTNWLPYRLQDLLIGQLIHFSTQRRLRRKAIELAERDEFDVVLEPSPITPKGLSFMYGLNRPVVVGPMCGGMNFPPAFASLDSPITRMVVRLSRLVSEGLNRLIPGKIQADILLVANETTRRALPKGVRGVVHQVFESGVDLEIWSTLPEEDKPGTATSDEVRFMFSGRFVDWKGIQFLLPAFEQAARQAPNIKLELIGGGGEYAEAVSRLANESGLSGRVKVHGWVSREKAAEILRNAHVFVMPSLRECGGTAILEAMALGKPVIATDWGGPADYVDSRCGVLVAPTSESEFVDGLASAMVKLAGSKDLREKLGLGARKRVTEDYLCWEEKADFVLQMLTSVHQLRATPRFEPR